jgi:hypothetical protein
MKFEYKGLKSGDKCLGVLSNGGTCVDEYFLYMRDGSTLQPVLLVLGGF